MFTRIKSPIWINTLTSIMGEMDECMKTCLCGAWYECILRTREPRKLSPLTCNIWQHSAPCMHLRRWHGPSSFPWTNDETNIPRVCDDMMQTRMCKSAWLIAQQGDVQAWWYHQIVIQQRRTWHLEDMHGSVKENKTRSVFSSCPYFRNLNGRN